MFKSRLGKLSVAGFAAAAGVILVVSTVGAHQAHATVRAGLMPFNVIGSTTEQAATAVESDADAAATGLTTQVEQTEAAELAAEQAQQAAEQAAEAAEDAADNETADNETETETETGDTGETGGATTGDNETEKSGTTASTGGD